MLNSSVMRWLQKRDDDEDKFRAAAGNTTTTVVWNSLPADLRQLNMSLSVFRKRLKMFLFN